MSLFDMQIFSEEIHNKIIILLKHFEIMRLIAQGSILVSYHMCGNEKSVARLFKEGLAVLLKL